MIRERLRTGRTQHTMRMITGIAVLASIWSMTGCLSPLALHRAVIEYDERLSDVESELLLLNVARARNGRPLHFTGVTNVAATFDFRTNGSVGGQLVENRGSPDFVRNLLTLNLGASFSENPTISIVPVQGEEFTKRIMTPLKPSMFGFLYRQGLEPAIILRLTARSIGVEDQGGTLVYLNMPHREAEYREFRRRILHLSALTLARELYMQPITFDESWPLPPDHPLSSQALTQGYRWADDGAEPPRLVRTKVGPPMITNYDLAMLSNEQRRRLFQKAHSSGSEVILVDIKPGYPGGEYPWQGLVKFRSFRNILAFLARSIEVEPEFHVEKDSRTGPVIWNPVRTLAIEESDEPPKDPLFDVEYEDRFYFIRREPPDERQRWSWNQQAFTILHQLFQMTMSEIPRTGALPITIAK